MKIFPIYQLPIYDKHVAQQVASLASKTKLELGSQQNIACYFAYLQTLTQDNVKKIVSESKNIVNK